MACTTFCIDVQRSEYPIQSAHGINIKVALRAKQHGEKFFKFHTAELVELCRFSRTKPLLPCILFVLLLAQNPVLVLDLGILQRVAQVVSFPVFL